MVYTVRAKTKLTETVLREEFLGKGEYVEKMSENIDRGLPRLRIERVGGDVEANETLVDPRENLLEFIYLLAGPFRGLYFKLHSTRTMQAWHLSP